MPCRKASGTGMVARCVNLFVRIVHLRERDRIVGAKPHAIGTGAAVLGIEGTIAIDIVSAVAVLTHRVITREQLAIGAGSLVGSSTRCIAIAIVVGRGVRTRVIILG